jgi:hypothetical protein
VKYRVHYEASAAIGMEIEVEAEDRDAAEALGQSMLENGLSEKLADAAADLFGSEPLAVEGYAGMAFPELRYAVTSLDENGFDLVDVFTDTDP